MSRRYDWVHGAQNCHFSDNTNETENDLQLQLLLILLKSWNCSAYLPESSRTHSEKHRPDCLAFRVNNTLFENLCLQPHKVTHSTAYSWPTAKNKWKCPRPRGYTDPKPWTFERVFYYCCCVEEWNIDDVTSVYTLTTFRLSCALGYKPTPHGINTPPPHGKHYTTHYTPHLTRPHPIFECSASARGEGLLRRGTDGVAGLSQKPH